MQLLNKKIIGQWDYWQSKLVKGQIAIAKKYDRLYTHVNSVIKALKHGNNGLLLIDSFFKKEIHRSLDDEAALASNQKLEEEIEKFLARGNRIEITEGGLLKTFGGIALIKEMRSPFQYHRRKKEFKEEDFMIYI